MTFKTVLYVSASRRRDRSRLTGPTQFLPARISPQLFGEAFDGPILGMYREPRGSITHPHRGETLTLGDLMVEGYERPEWTFNKLVYIERKVPTRR
jgi:hypothetical protein